MIFTSCTQCDAPIIVGYEAGDPGAGAYVREVCDECQAENYVKLTSFGGQTLSAAEAERIGLVRIRPDA